MRDALFEHRAGELDEMRADLRRWRRLACLAMGLFILVLLHDLFLSLTKRESLHVVELTQDHQELWIGPPNSYKLDDLWVETTLMTWIKHCRSHPDDKPVASEWKAQCLNKADKQAYRDMDAYFKQWEAQQLQRESPANKMRVQIRDIVKHHVTKNVWEVWWTEDWAPRYGDGAKSIKMNGTFTIERRTSKGFLGSLVSLNIGDQRRAPLGLYVIDASFSSIETANGQR